MEVGLEITELRPLTLGELLDRTFTLYRSNFWLFVGIMAIPSAFSVPFSIVFFSMRGPTVSGGKPSPAFAVETLLVGLAFFVLFGVVYAIATGAATYAVSETYLGQRATVRGSYGKVRGKFWRILGVVALAWLRAFGMMLVMIVGLIILVTIEALVMRAVTRGRPGPAFGVIFGAFMFLSYLAGIGLWLLWSLRYAVSIPALLLESLGVRAAIRRSVKLTRGRRWQVLVAIVLCTIVAYVGVIVFQGPFFMTILFSARAGQLPEWLTFTYAMSGAVGGAITGPLVMIVLVLCYYDTRIRKEAFDLQFMMSSLDHPTPAQDTPSPA
jgi:hypothetical protein